jgi:hypothetical protein
MINDEMLARFPTALLEKFDAAKYLYIRSGDHRFIAIWVVVVDGRVIVRSWNDKPKGWFRAFLSEPYGHVRLGHREIPIRAVPVRNKDINDIAQAAYAAKYTSKSNAKYVEGLASDRRKATTLELIPG